MKAIIYSRDLSTYIITTLLHIFQLHLLKSLHSSFDDKAKIKTSILLKYIIKIIIIIILFAWIKLSENTKNEKINKQTNKIV